MGERSVDIGEVRWFDPSLVYPTVVAQRNRVSACEAEGRVFESRQPYDRMDGMPKKINLKREKRERNEAYALRFKKDVEKDDKQRDTKRQGGLWGNWCRVKGHLPGCSVMTCKQK